MPFIVPDKDLRTIYHVGCEIGWSSLVKDTYVIDNDTSPASLFIPLRGALSKFEKWRIRPTTCSFDKEK